ncbi:hypothetical protein TNCT_101001 [Trichonephila clavata]|uniref:Uncharacterized protein n=1 Tax=Trichonephila clavata TaxID=2740835 RepID=A0A8X6J9B5_TRICU|nr:hypothetical protein TNCT_101001 [Trichonephila clavata]
MIISFQFWYGRSIVLFSYVLRWDGKLEHLVANLLVVAERPVGFSDIWLAAEEKRTGDDDRTLRRVYIVSSWISFELFNCISTALFSFNPFMM